MLRSGKENPADIRLLSLYFYYFDTYISDLIGSRIIICEGDVTDQEKLAELEQYPIDTVINCAAVVKHFSAGTIIEHVNLGGAENLIAFCLKTGAALIQTSTMSVVSAAHKDSIPAGFLPDERSLYFNQLLDNKYVHSKFLAERAVMEAAAKKGLRGKIMRLGNLAARSADGEFQVNSGTNSAMGRLRAFAMLGCASYGQLENTMEFSPIDAVAKAIVLLSATPDECTVFHVFNDQRITLGRIFSEMSVCGYPVEFVEAEQFAKAFTEAKNDPKRSKWLTSIMAYMEPEGGRETVRLTRQCGYTLQVLYRLGFSWPFTTWDYIAKFVSVLTGSGFFDEETIEL